MKSAEAYGCSDARSYALAGLVELEEGSESVGRAWNEARDDSDV